MADSDSDLPDDDMDEAPEANHGNKKKSKSKETFIQEGEEEIVDLADIKSIGNILTTKPGKATNAAGGALKKSSKDPNRGFNTAEDGRLIIDDKMGSDSDDDDEKESDIKEEDSNPNRRMKRVLEEDSSEGMQHFFSCYVMYLRHLHLFYPIDEEMPMASSRKRQALDTISMKTGKSGKSTATSKYVAGGKGIHRPVAASVKSGYSAKSRVSSASTKTAGAFGTDYKSNKAKGDMKRKGKLDPFAYIPLSRNILNKR